MSKRVQGLCKLTPKMSEILGVTEVTRCDGLKIMWNYIKNNRLQDVERKGIYKSSPLLLEAFGKSEFKPAELLKLMYPHFVSIKDQTPKKKQKVKVSDAPFAIPIEVATISQSKSSPSEVKLSQSHSLTAIEEPPHISKKIKILNPLIPLVGKSRKSCSEDKTQKKTD